MKAMLFAATVDASASQTFYEQALGLQFLADTPFALVFEINGIALRVQKVEQVVPVPYTTLGFEVPDLEAKIDELTSRGVVFEHYEFLQQNELGVWIAPDGAKIAWCKDPDGNVISVSEHPE